MKGVKTMSLANGTAKRFHSDELIANSIRSGGIDIGETLKTVMEDNKKLADQVKELTTKVKELQDKYDELVTE